VTKVPSALPAIRNDLLPDAEPMTLRQQLLAHLSLRPYDTPQQIAQALGVSPYTVQVLQSSDEFKLALSERFTVGQIRAKARVTEVAVKALDSLERLMDPLSEAPFAVRLEAARVTLAHVERVTQPQAQAAAAPTLSVNVAITQDDLTRARSRALEHARTITVDAAPALDADALIKDTTNVTRMGHQTLPSRGGTL
jgi:DNA-binding CsgD family transcriptional regulator